MWRLFRKQPQGPPHDASSGSGNAAYGLMTVVLPCLNEEANLKDTVLRKDVEIILVDGGSSDNTLKVAKSLQLKVLTSRKGRGCQMNAGAAAAKGDLLLFLHADSQLPARYSHVLHEAWSDYSKCKGYEAAWGCFKSIAFKEPSWQGKLLQISVALRTRLLRLPYGDQGIFVKADVFRDVGGYKDIPLLEDVDLVTRLRRRAAPVIVPVPIVTSARRWQRLGFMRVTCTNQLILAAWYLGVSPSTLAAWYYPTNSKGPGLTGGA